MRLPFHKLSGETGPDVVMVHGFGADRMSWMANAPALAGYQVWGVDLPGHGEAEPILPTTLEAVAHILADTIKAHVEGAFHLVGHSLGGGVALELARLMPQRVQSLCLIAPAGLGYGVDADFLTGFPTLSDAATAETLLQKLVARPRLINRFMVARVLDHLAKPGRREALAGIATQLTDLRGALDGAIAAVRVNAIAHLTIWGAKDAINPLDASKLADFGGEQLILPESGHMPQVEDSRAVNNALKAFIDQHASL